MFFQNSTNSKIVQNMEKNDEHNVYPRLQVHVSINQNLMKSIDEILEKRFITKIYYSK